MATLGATVRSLRTRAGLSQDDLAQLVGLSQAQISRLERGHWERIRPEFLVQLASVLGVSPADLLPDTTPWQAAAPAQADALRVGCWESVWAAPVIGLFGTSFTGNHPELPGDPPSRPLTPSELMRALKSSNYDAIVVPRQMVFESPNELTECAQVAIAVDGVHIAVCFPGEDLLPTAIGAPAAFENPALRATAVWDRIRSASTRSPVPIYFPPDASAIEMVHDLRRALNGGATPLAVSLEQWPSFLVDSNDIATWGGGPVIAVAPEPYLDAWRRGLSATGAGLATVVVTSREVWADPPPAISALSLIFHRDRCEDWLTNPLVYEFLDAVQRQAQEIAQRSPRVLALIADRLHMDVPAILHECARCDFTTRFAPSWVARLRAHSRAIAV
jgi:DNA-binding Xre family transcriptional regulator